MRTIWVEAHEYATHCKSRFCSTVLKTIFYEYCVRKMVLAVRDLRDVLSAANYPCVRTCAS